MGEMGTEELRFVVVRFGEGERRLGVGGGAGGGVGGGADEDGGGGDYDCRASGHLEPVPFPNWLREKWEECPHVTSRERQEQTYASN